jgi:hypothetical protein
MLLVHRPLLHGPPCPKDTRAMAASPAASLLPTNLPPPPTSHSSALSLVPAHSWRAWCCLSRMQLGSPAGCLLSLCVLHPPLTACPQLRQQRMLPTVSTLSTARLMPLRRSMGFMPAATDLQPSFRMARASTVAVVVPAGSTQRAMCSSRTQLLRIISTQLPAE